jgi:hypothetical protein
MESGAYLLLLVIVREVVLGRLFQSSVGLVRLDRLVGLVRLVVEQLPRFWQPLMMLELWRELPDL